jgi:hypothetical protein
MKILSRGSWLALALALLIVGFTSPLPAAGAESASLRIPGAAFRPRSDAVHFEYFNAGSMFCTYAPQGSVWWTAPVYLPQGAVVTSVRMFYYDKSTTNNCDASFEVYDFANESVFFTTAWSSSGSSGLGSADSGAINHTIDYSKYGYLLQWRPNTVSNDELRLVGFQIFYKPPPGRVAVIPLY